MRLAARASEGHSAAVHEKTVHSGITAAAREITPAAALPAGSFRLERMRFQGNEKTVVHV